MSPYESLQLKLRAEPRLWLVTGAAGFIGSHLVSRLLQLDQKVVGVDNFLTGHRRNLDSIRAEVGNELWQRFTFHQADVRDPAACHRLCVSVDHVLHQAALGSVPRSLRLPFDTHDHNLNGFLQLMMAAREAGVRRFVYASSSAVYGDHPALPKREEAIGRPLSPYALSKWSNELYAEVFARCYGFASVGLRYFNVFGPRQSPDGPYAAVIPKWLAALARGEPIQINGDGETSRDFCYVENVVQANLLAAAVPLDKSETLAPASRVYNVAAGGRTTLNQLYGLLSSRLAALRPGIGFAPVTYAPFRAGDVRHSQADISAIRADLGYEPAHDLASGLSLYVPWYLGWQL